MCLAGFKVCRSLKQPLKFAPQKVQRNSTLVLFLFTYRFFRVLSI